MSPLPDNYVIYRLVASIDRKLHFFYHWISILILSFQRCILITILFFKIYFLLTLGTIILFFLSSDNKIIFVQATQSRNLLCIWFDHLSYLTYKIAQTFRFVKGKLLEEFEGDLQVPDNLSSLSVWLSQDHVSGTFF